MNESLDKLNGRLDLQRHRIPTQLRTTLFLRIKYLKDIIIVCYQGQVIIFVLHFLSVDTQAASCVCASHVKCSKLHKPTVPCLF